MNFLTLAMLGQRRGEPERHVTIPTRAILKVEPPSVRTTIANGTSTTTLTDPRYSVMFKVSRGFPEFGRAWADDLKFAGIPLPPGEATEEQMARAQVAMAEAWIARGKDR